MKALITLTLCAILLGCRTKAPDYSIELTSPTNLYTPEVSWAQPRIGTIPPRAPGNPTDTPIVVMTMQHIFLHGSDLFGPLHQMRTDDLGKTWEGPSPVPGYELRPLEENRVLNIADFTPRWHAGSGKLLGTGVTTVFQNGKKLDRPKTPALKRWTAYAAYDPAARTWSPWKTLEMPAGKFDFAGAGCTQRYDLPNGDILLPISYGVPSESPAPKQYGTTVVRCRFDGETLSYVEHGSELTVNIDRGLYEPSITKYRGRFYLTMRNDRAGYIATSKDGLHFDEPRKWTWDDGTDLGSYNTQQHWVTHSNGLFLVYTRRGANNDNVFRHRAPLFIAQVDPVKLQVLRATERELMPNRATRLGNFSVSEVSPNETWVSDCEWMQPAGREKFGADGSVWVTKIHWKTPNAYAK